MGVRLRNRGIVTAAGRCVADGCRDGGRIVAVGKNVGKRKPMPPWIRAIAGLLAAGALLATIAPAGAQVVFPLQNPSVRSAGMGGSSAAVVWDEALNPWANPALLGYATGLTVRWSRADLSYFAPPVRFRAGGIVYGWGGLGLSYGHDGIRLDLAPYDPFGNPLPPAEISQRVRHWGGAVSVSRVLETLRGDGPLPGLLGRADLALGFARKRGDFLHAGFGGAGETAAATDLGLLARVTPLPETSGRRLSLDFTYGYSSLAEPFYRTTRGVTPDHRRHGVGARFGTPLSADGPTGAARRLVRWLARPADPILALTIAADFDRYDDVGIFSGPRSQTSRDIGAELALAGALAVRFGHIRDEVQQLDSFCFGFGIGVPVADVARLRYEYARFPSSGFDGGELGNRHAVSAWFDPAAMVRRR